MTTERQRKPNKLAAILFFIAAALALTAGVMEWRKGKGWSVRGIAPGVFCLAMGIGLLSRSGKS